MTLELSSIRRNIEVQQITRLRASIHGQILIPEDIGYDSARQAWNLAVDQHPAIILIAHSANDIVEAVRFANVQDLSIAVQATGHGVIREANDSLLIVTSQMTDVRVDTDSQTAWIGAGAKWGRVLTQTQIVGLAPLLGSSPDVGAVGYTLGGGMGWLARKYGLSTDNVNYFEVVTTDGEIVRASQIENDDLFWGLRGGGGNFGIVTGMEIRLHPVTTVYGGNLFYTIQQAKEIYTRFRQWIVNAPDELTSSVVLMNFPPMPEIPELLRGQSFVLVRGCYCGSVQEGEMLMEYWRNWQTPLLDDFKKMPFSDVATISNDPVDPVPGVSSGAWLANISNAVADILTHYILPQGGAPMLMFAEIRHAGGAIAWVDSGSAAYGNRNAMYSLQVVGVAPTPEIKRAVRKHIAQLKSDLMPHLHGGIYMNFLEGEEARDRTRQGFSPEAYTRLRALKTKYDPRNMFSHSYDIPPVNIEED